jgi:hypothetical protein
MLENEILKLNVLDIEILKIIIKEIPQIGINEEFLFKSCKICKQQLNNIIRYFLIFNKEMKNFNNSFYIVRFFIIDYNETDKTSNIVISL